MDWKKKEYWLVIVLLLLTLVYTSAIRYREVFPPNSVDLNKIPVNLSGWEGQDFFIDDRVQEVLKADFSLMRRYTDQNGNIIWLFIGYFKDQKYGSQIHSPKHCLPGGGWKISETRKIEIPNINHSSKVIKANDFYLTKNLSNSRMIYWFETRSGIIHEEYMLKVDLIKNALVRKPTDAVFIRFNTEYLTLGNESEEMMVFITELYPFIENALQFRS